MYDKQSMPFSSLIVFDQVPFVKRKYAVLFVFARVDEEPRHKKEREKIRTYTGNGIEVTDNVSSSEASKH